MGIGPEPASEGRPQPGILEMHQDVTGVRLVGAMPVRRRPDRRGDPPRASFPGNSPPGLPVQRYYILETALGLELVKSVEARGLIANHIGLASQLAGDRSRGTPHPNQQHVGMMTLELRFGPDGCQHYPDRGERGCNVISPDGSGEEWR